MDSDERLKALKIAYADVVLNLSKEAAAKIMVAERKAQGLEHEIRRTKEEAVQMMVRLKKKMDDEIMEANMTSQNQQKKIDELEAQLAEAEDIVTELREQLSNEQARFYRVTRSDKHSNATPEEAFEENTQSQSIPYPTLEFQKDSLVVSDKENPYLIRRTEYPKCSSDSQMRNLYGIMPELPSIILRSKKHKVYRNACTQRIHACERDILDNELPLPRQPDDASGKGKVEGEKKDISTCKVALNEVDKMFNIEGKEVVGNNGSISCWYEVHPKLIPREVKTDAMYRKNTMHRKNETTETNVNVKEGETEKLISKGKSPVKTATNKYTKNDGTLGEMISNKMFIKGHKTCGVRQTDSSPKSVEDNLLPNENPPAKKPKLSLDIAVMVAQPGCAKTTETNENDKEGDNEKLIPKGKPPIKTATQSRKNRSTLGKKTPGKLFMKRHETPGVPHSDPSPKSIENNPQPNEDLTLRTPKLSLDIAGMETQPESAKTTETIINDKEGDTEKLTSNGEPPVDKVVPLVQEGTLAESTDIHGSESNLKKVDEPILQSMLKTTDATIKGSSLQHFKYTFQRKRKRETMSICDVTDVDVLADNHTPERKKETQNTSVEPEKYSLVADSSLESRQ